MKSLNDELQRVRREFENTLSETADIKAMNASESEARESVDATIELLAPGGENAVRKAAGHILALAQGPKDASAALRGHVLKDGFLEAIYVTPAAVELQAFLDPGRLRKALLKAVEGRFGELTKEAREARLMELSTKLRALEVEEERLIRQLEAEGVVVDRRADARPEIVLGDLEKLAA